MKVEQLMNFDMVILDLIQGNMKSGLMDSIMPLISHLGDSGTCMDYPIYRPGYTQENQEAWLCDDNSHGIKWNYNVI